MENTHYSQLKEAILETINECSIKQEIKLTETEIVYDGNIDKEIKITGRVGKAKQMDVDEFREKLYDSIADRVGSEVATDFINKNFSFTIGWCEGEKFPGIDVFDYDGNRKPLKHEAGNVILIDFWATWCQYCQEPMQENINFALKDKTLNEKGIYIVGISCDEDTNKWKSHLDSKQWRVIGQYVKSGLLKEVGIKGIPCIGIVGKDGKFVYWGHPTLIQLEESLYNLAEGKPIKKLNEDTEKDTNPFWNEFDSDKKLMIVREINQTMKDNGISQANFCVSSQFSFDPQSETTKPSKVKPIFYGEVAQHEYDVIQELVLNLQSKYPFKDLVYNLKVNQFKLDEDF